MAENSFPIRGDQCVRIAVAIDSLMWQIVCHGT